MLSNELLQLGDELRQQRLVPRRQRRHAHDVHVVLDGLPRGFLGRLEQRPHVDVEAQVGEGRRDDLGPPVMAVLPHLGNQDSGAPALVFLELTGAFLE